MATTISICIPCYKSERYIRTTIESALAQTVPADELLISDDNSPDRSFEIVKEYEGLPRVRIIRPAQRISLGEHYRFLLEHSRGDYLCFLSSDDALMPTFLETMRGKIENNVSLVAAASLECNEKLIPRRARGTGLPSTTLNPPEGFHFFSASNGYTISFALLARQFLLQFPPLPKDADLATDWYWALMLGTKGKVKFLRTPLGYYRVHGSNAGHDNADNWRKACAAMLAFTKRNINAGLGQPLDGRLEEIQKAVTSAEGGEVETFLPPSLKTRAKESARKLVALRYRSLPEFILKAEQGIGMALTAARSQVK